MTQIKNGKTLFEQEIMQTKYTNPYLAHPKTKEQLRRFCQEAQPVMKPEPLVKLIEEWREPLYSQRLVQDEKVGLTTGRPWMPTGQNLESLSRSINDAVQVNNKVQQSVLNRTTSYFHKSKHSHDVALTFSRTNSDKSLDSTGDRLITARQTI